MNVSTKENSRKQKQSAFFSVQKRDKLDKMKPAVPTFVFRRRSDVLVGTAKGPLLGQVRSTHRTFMLLHGFRDATAATPAAVARRSGLHGFGVVLLLARMDQVRMASHQVFDFTLPNKDEKSINLQFLERSNGFSVPTW